MNLAKVLTTSLFLFTSGILFAEGPLCPATLLHTDNIVLQNNLSSGVGASNSSPMMLIKPTLFQKLELEVLLGFNVTTNPIPGVAKALFFANPQFGPVFGGAAALPLGYYWGIRMEVLYSSYDFSSIPVVLSPFLFGNRLGYIDIPLEVQYKPIKNLCFTLGGIYSILINNSSFVQSQTIGESASQQYPNNNVSGNILRIAFGASYKVGFLIIGGRLSFGSPYSDSKIRSAGVGQFTLSYRFQRKFQEG